MNLWAASQPPGGRPHHTMTHTPPIDIVVYGQAQPAGSKTLGRTKAGGHFIRDANPRAADWKRSIAAAAGIKAQGQPLLEGPLFLACHFIIPRPQGHYGKRGLLPSARKYPTVKPDTTKLLRAVEDALTGILWRDDSQVIVQHTSKIYGEPARCEIHIAPLEAHHAGTAA